MSTRIDIKELRLDLKKNGEYFENHHIVPKCKGGSNDKSNLVLLTSREHFLAHKLLWLIYRDRQMALAFHKMLSSNKSQKRFFSSRDYEEAREAYRITNIGNTYGKAGKGRILKTRGIPRPKHSILMQGENNPFYGKTHTKETKQKLSEARKNSYNPKKYGKKVLLKDGIIIGIFDSTLQIAEYLNCSNSNVGHCLYGKQATVKGHVVKNEKDLQTIIN
jgi:hypothetical protein